jgi:phosphoribosylanthranilate isomerase
MIVKVCGITNLDDALAAIACGSTALGFNFYPRSTRYIGLADAAKLVSGLPPEILKVGVFVNEPAARVADLVKRIGLQVAQLHGDEKPNEYPPNVRVWKAARVDGDFTWEAWQTSPAEALLLDSAAAGVYGGSGETFDWARATGAGSRHIIMSGGLDAGNVAEAIRLVQPWGVDACSKIERAPGRKDHAKMAAFVKAALEASVGMGAGV